MIVAICGKAGSGKSTVADILARDHQFVVVSLADPIKRICKDVFDFTDEQLWGPSEARNAPDIRYPHAFAGSRSEPREWLSPRYALQTLGTEWGRRCYENVWVEKAIRIAKALATDHVFYTAKGGLEPWFGREGRDIFRDVVVPDARFHNEVAAIHAAGGIVWKTQHGVGLEGAAGAHESERHIDSLEVDALVPRGPLEEMPALVAKMLADARYAAKTAVLRNLPKAPPGRASR